MPRVQSQGGALRGCGGRSPGDSGGTKKKSGKPRHVERGLVPSPYASMRERLIFNSVESRDNYYLDPKTGEKTFCWEWIGGRSNSGYPFVTIRRKRGPKKGKPQRKGAHRVSLVEFMDRTLSSRQNALHLCNNQNCIHPNHLKGGTQKQNMRQCVKDGRHGNMFRSPVRDERNDGAAIELLIHGYSVVL